MSVIIVGAGASGLTAGHYLIENGFEVLILEGSDKIGGRAQKLEGFSDFPIELGGEEIYNKKGLYYQICESVGAQIYPRKDPQTYVEHPQEKRLMRFDEYQQLYPREANVIDILTEEAKKDPSFKNLTADQAWEKLKLNPMFKFWGEECMGTENGGDWSVVNVDQIADVEDLFPTFDDCYLMKNMSHQDVLTKAFTKAVSRTKLQSEVVSIDYSAKNRVNVLTKSGEKYEADHVLVTSNVKVLQNQMISFTPKLPHWKQSAIDEIGIEPAGKLYLKFSEPIFNPEITIMYLNFHAIFAWVGSDERSRSPEYILTFLVPDKIAAKIDQNETKFIDSLLSHLESIGSKPNLKSKLLDKLWKNWAHERLVIGAHSFDSPKTKDNSRELYAKQIDNKLFFAGEATNFEGRHGAINGAVDTGKRAADEIIALK